MQLEELEYTYKGKIAAEIDRYDKLIASRDTMSQQWDKSNATLISNHQQHIANIVAEHEAKVTAEEVRALNVLAGVPMVSSTFRLLFSPAGPHS